MKIVDVILTRSYSAFYFDDQAAIKKGADHDGFMYVGEPITNKFSKIRMPGEAISIQLLLENGLVGVGDCAAVQYSGVGGRDPLFLADEFIPFINKHIKPLLINEELTTFKELSNKYDNLVIDGKKLHTAIRYGITQALLSAIAVSTQRNLVEVIRDEYNPDNKIVSRVPIFAQSGDERYINVDKMILKSVDCLPHGLINNVESKLGVNGEKLYDYVCFLRDRIIENRVSVTYLPDFHIDTYGTLGIAFNNDIEKITNYLITLENAAKPFHIRIEGPVDAGERELTMVYLRDIRKNLESKGSKLEIVADEWCNTLEDIKYFADNKAGHMLQIKTPDLGGINNVAEAILYCREKNIGAYCGGTCNETNISAEATTSIAIACQADLCLAKPGMDVDGGFMIVNNFMQKSIALANLKYEKRSVKK